MTLLAAIAVTLLTWASAFAAIRHAAHAFPPASLALVRFAIASVVLAGFWWWRGRKARAAGADGGAPRAIAPAPSRGEWARLALAGLFTIGIYQVSLNAGSRTVTAGVACLLVNTGPIFTA
ncbi:MAG TPA: EamA family transporter, partial [Candidatus Eisenbacteria bacterium]|nr:EamA family transporter [Candidatus Eisenbacteria bacterium]